MNCLVAKGLIAQKSYPLRIEVSKKESKMYVYEKGKLVFTYAVSLGKGKNTTPNFNKALDGRMFKRHSSNKYPGGDYNGLGNMPYCIVIQGSYAIHGTVKSNFVKLGEDASHGCIRLHSYRAEQLFNLVKKYGAKNTWIKVSATTKSTLIPAPQKIVKLSKTALHNKIKNILLKFQLADNIDDPVTLVELLKFPIINYYGSKNVTINDFKNKYLSGSFKKEYHNLNMDFRKVSITEGLGCLLVTIPSVYISRRDNISKTRNLTQYFEFDDKFKIRKVYTSN